MTLLRSLSFRLALFYAALFSLSVLLLGGLYYFVAIRGPMIEVRSQLASEARQFEELYRSRGAGVTAEALERRAGEMSPRAGYHALLDGSGEPIATNLPSWPPVRTSSWLRIEADIARAGDEDEHEALALDLPLPGGRLLLGRDIDDLDELEEALRETIYWLLPALILLSIVGGALMSRAIGRRIEGVSTVARTVIAGDLSGRVPVRGTGDDFDRLGETLNLMLERIEQALESVRRVSDSVAHELRTPLTRLRASLAELERDPSPASLAEAVREAERLNSIFNAVLRISRLEAAATKKADEAVDLSLVIEDALEFYQPAAEAKGQNFDVAIASSLVVAGDRDLIFQAIANLVDNAVKFGALDGKVKVRAWAGGGSVHVSVEDEGPGVPAELRDRLTERFFRAPGTHGIPGEGLGLALVDAVASLHDSQIHFDSDGAGFRVTWSFPSASG